MQRRVLRPVLSLAVAIAPLALSACAAAPARGPWRLEWDVSVREQILGDELSGVLALPVDIEGEETWWVGERLLVLESRGQEVAGARGEGRTWITAGEKWVYIQDATGALRRVMRRRWDEDRRRAQRAAMVSALRAPGLADLGGLRYSFLARLELRRHQSGRATRWWTLSALPGSVWRLSGSCGSHGFWRSPLIPLAFDGVTPELTEFLNRALGRAAPAVVEEVALPAGGETTVLRRELRRVTVGGRAESPPAVPADLLARLEEREREWQGFEMLWSFLVNPDHRPRELEAREVRARLEECAGEAQLPIIEARIAASEGMADLEELLHLKWVIAPGAFAEQLRATRDAGDLPRLLAFISVLSLRAPSHALQWVAEAMAEDPVLWESLDAAERDDARAWLAGVHAWLETLPASRSEAAPVQL